MFPFLQPWREGSISQRDSSRIHAGAPVAKGSALLYGDSSIEMLALIPKGVCPRDSQSRLCEFVTIPSYAVCMSILRLSRRTACEKSSSPVPLELAGHPGVKPTRTRTVVPDHRALLLGNDT